MECAVEATLGRIEGVTQFTRMVARVTLTVPESAATALYERALARPPASSDVDRALTFIAQVEKSMEPRETDTAKRHLFAWQSFCKALLATNEFVYIN